MLSLHKAVEKKWSLFEERMVRQTVDKLENEMNANNANNTRNNQLWQRCKSHRQLWQSVTTQMQFKTFRTA